MMMVKRTYISPMPHVILNSNGHSKLRTSNWVVVGARERRHEGIVVGENRAFSSTWMGGSHSLFMTKLLYHPPPGPASAVLCESKVQAQATTQYKCLPVINL